MDLVNMFTRLAHIEPRRDWSTEASTEFHGATNDNNETWTTTSNWTRSGSGMVSFTGDDLDAAMLRHIGIDLFQQKSFKICFFLDFFHDIQVFAKDKNDQKQSWIEFIFERVR